MLFGAHCSGGVKKALERAAEIGAEAVQLFVQSPRAWRFPEHDPADLERFRQRRSERWGCGPTTSESSGRETAPTP